MSAGRRKRSRLIAPAGAIAFALLAGAQTAAQQDPATVNALWVAESSGVLKVATADGSLRLEIPGLANVRAIAVDHHRPMIWLYAGQNLYAYGYDGSQELVVPLSLPNPSSASLAVNEQDGSVWLGADQNLVSISSSGQALRSVRLVANVKSLAIDAAGLLLWAGTSSSATAFDAISGAQVLSLDLGSSPDLRDLDLDPTGRVWVALGAGVRRYAEDGTLLLAAPLTQSLHVAGDGHGGAWVATAKNLLRLSPAGQVTASVSPFGAQAKIVEVVLDPSNDNAWVANDTAVAQVDAVGHLVRAFQFQPPVHIWDLALYADVIPPQLTFTAPADGSYLNTKTPTLKVTYTDIGSGVNPATLAFQVNGLPLQVSCATSSGGASCVASNPLPDGPYSVTGTVEDYAGNTSQPASVTFTLDTTPPAPISASKVVVSAASGGQVTVTAGPGSAEAAAMASITNSRTGQVTSVTVAADGSLVATVAGQAGDVLQIVLTDTAGNHSSATSVTVPGNPGSGGLPPDPATVASPIDPTVPTDIAVTTAFLYSGPNPIQTGVAPGTIDPRRAAVLRGKVLDRNGSPLPGVTVTVFGHPEFGSTVSRLDGLFDLVVNGGGTVVVQYDKSGYARVQRRLPAPWRDYTWVESVVLVPYDTQVTVVTTGSTTLQVARGTTARDQDGARTATLLFPPGTHASMTLADGSSQSLPTLSVRATEFTVGSTGPAAMPAKLPPTSAFTYAVELSCDEAQSAGAQSVTFSQPVVQYVENFLGFPVGGTVPVGYYDRALAAWVASANGRVIGMLSVTNGLADLDLTGSGSAATATDLAALGISDAERGELAALYQPGQSLWRVPISHFTPYDWNWPYFPPADATPPDQPPPQSTDKPEDDSDCQHGSIILCQNQALGEVVPIVGTPLSLRYVSDRVPGHSAGRSITIPLSGPRVPASLKRIEVQVSVAGQLFTQTFPATANQSYLFTAPGLDAYGRPLQGDAKVTVVIAYVYGTTYALPVADGLAFAQFRYPTILATFLNRATNEYTLRQQYETYLGTLGFWDARGIGLGGWTLNVHHTYDANSGVLYYGSGKTKRTSASSYGRIVSPAVALSATEEAVCLGRDDGGNLYLCSFNHILKVAPGGAVTTVAGQTFGGFAGDGGPATAAMLSQPRGVAVDRSGNLYIADTSNNRIRKVDTQGIITTIAGNNGSVCADQSCNNVPGTAASLTGPEGIAVDGEGNVYLADTGIGIIRRIGLDGIITTVAGNGGFLNYPADGAATSLALRNPQAVAFDNSGNLLIGDTLHDVVVRINPNGSVTEVAGGPEPIGLAMDQEGSLFVASIGGSLGGTVAKWLPDLSRAVIAGEVSSFGSTLDNIPATAATLSRLFGAVVDGDGSILVADGQRVLRIGNLLPGFTAGELDIPSENGEHVYVFDREGRHLRTTNALTGATLLTFGYDLSGRLASVTDGDGNTTTIERDSNGQMTAIVAPFDQRTLVSVGGDGYVATITDPAGEAVHLTYQAGGLLAAMSDAKGNASHFTYDPVGRLALDSDAASGFKQLTRTERPTGYTVGLVTALGRASSYSIDEDLAGDKTRSNLSPAGLLSTTLMKTDGSQSTSSADGTAVSVRWGPDPRFGMLAPLVAARQVTTPGGLVYSSSLIRSLSTPSSGPVLTDALTVNGNTFTRTFNAAQRIYSLTSPLGRQLSTVIDIQGRPLQMVVGNLAPTSFSYDGRGRPTSITVGTGADARSTTLTYDGLSRIATVTDPLQETVSLTYDAADRVIQQVLADSQALAAAFDADGNALSFTPPGRPAHAFSYSAVNLLTGYTAPALAGASTSTTYAYDVDGELTQVARPDGQAVTAVYDSAGRIAAITDGRGARTFSYDSATGNVSSITAPDGGQVSYLYDGSLVTRTTWSGLVAGTIDRTFNADFRVASLSVDGGNATSFVYDADGLLTQAGALTLQHDGNGLLTGSSLGVVGTSTTYDAFAEPTDASVTANGTPLYTSQYTRDKLGRITQKVETIGGTTDTYTYVYDARGRLTTVAKDGTTLSTYTYDATGNRLSWAGPAGSRAATYDSQDRLLQYGDLTYTYQPSGELASKTQNGQTMSFTFDAFGNLVGVTTPSGIAISYLVDGRNRRIGKVVNGTLVSGFLYRDQLAPLAQLDGSGNVVAVFVYGTRLNVPDYMVTGGNTYRIVTDHLGSPRLVIDATTGETVQRMDYDEFGQVILDTNPGFQPFGFAGGLYDPQTGLVRFGFRDYDPQTGRWTTKDLFGLASGAPTLYQYASSDPVNNNDVLGLNDCNAYKPLADWLCNKIKKLAEQLNVDPLLLLALAAVESGWNDDKHHHPENRPTHAVELNNPFGVTHAGGNNIHFSSLDSAFKFWGDTYGDFVKGADNPTDFLAGLKNAHYNSKNPNYEDFFADVFDSAVWFAVNCKDKCWGE